MSDLSKEVAQPKELEQSQELNTPPVQFQLAPSLQSAELLGLDAPVETDPAAAQSHNVHKANQRALQMKPASGADSAQMGRPSGQDSLQTSSAQGRTAGIVQKKDDEEASEPLEPETDATAADDEAPTAEQAQRIRTMAKMRDAYEAEVAGIKGEAQAKLGSGSTEEEAARHASAKRREIGIKYKDLTPADKRAKIYARNLKKYGDKYGPSPDYLHDKKGKSWGEIIVSAATPGGEDIIPGLLAEGLGRPDFAPIILTKRGGGSSWFDIVSELTKGK